MKIVVDTNVFISGVFFAGLPYEILDAWRCGIVGLVISRPIFDEYRRVGAELAFRFPKVEFQPWPELLAAETVMVESPPISERVCRDADDDKFRACAIAGDTRFSSVETKIFWQPPATPGSRCSRQEISVERYLR